jgi:hypothetical protein
VPFSVFFRIFGNFKKARFYRLDYYYTTFSYSVQAFLRDFYKIFILLRMLFTLSLQTVEKERSMENKSYKKSEEVLAEIYRNAQLALQSIADIMPQVEDEDVKAELEAQHEEYERFSAKAAMIAKNRGIELKEPNPFKKAMMWGSIKMSTLTDNSRSHIADMMVQGTVMGNTSLRASAGEIDPDENDEIYALLNEMLTREEQFEKKWKEYL